MNAGTENELFKFVCNCEKLHLDHKNPVRCAKCGKIFPWEEEAEKIERKIKRADRKGKSNGSQR